MPRILSTDELSIKALPAPPKGLTTKQLAAASSILLRTLDHWEAKGTTLDARVTSTRRTLAHIEKSFLVSRWLDANGLREPAAKMRNIKTSAITSAGRQEQDPSTAELNQLYRQLYRLNPFGLSGVTLSMDAKRGQTYPGSAATTRYNIPDDNTMRQYRRNSHRSPVFTYDGNPGRVPDFLVGNQHGLMFGPWMPSLTEHPQFPKVYQHYFEQLECMECKHNSSPLYLFHSLAWAKRMYAEHLDRLEYIQCPFLGHLPHYKNQATHAGLTKHNSSAEDIRYLIEAVRYWNSWSGNHNNKVWKSSPIGKLPMIAYWDDMPQLDPSGSKTGYELQYVHSHHPEYTELVERDGPSQGLNKDATTIIRFYEIIEIEAHARGYEVSNILDIIAAEVVGVPKDELSLDDL